MKCLSIKQPWAYLIMEGIKDIENRSWPTKIRGRVLIHASKAFDKEGALELSRDGVWFPSLLPTGVILGSVEITECHPSSDLENAVWNAHHGFCFVLEKPIKLIQPWPYKGKLRFFSVNAENLIKEISA